MDDPVDDSPPNRAPRRVATAPIPLRPSSTQGDTPDADSELVETLYSHPNAKIVSFTATGRAFHRNGLPKDDEPGTLSWSSQLERTIAVGSFRIYRAPRSVAFLSSGSALQPILPKSQCWCIDEINSKFVLQIRRPNYWRIELPVDDPEDQRRAEELREVFDKILQFEKTECPFKRSFTVELPDQTPVKYRPWAPTAGPAFDSVTPASSAGSRRSSFAARASTPTHLSTEYHTDNSTSPVSSRPGSAASSAPPHSHSKVPKPESKSVSGPTQANDDAWRAIYEDRRAIIDEHLRSKTFGIPEDPSEHDSTPMETAPERPTEQYSSDYFLSALPETPSKIPPGSGSDKRQIGRLTGLGVMEESYGSSSFSTGSEVITSHDDPSVLSSSPKQDEASVYQLHEGTGYRGGRMKAKLRRNAGAVTRSATLPPHLMLATIDKSSTPTPSGSRDPLQRSASESLSKSAMHKHTADGFPFNERNTKVDSQPSQPPQLLRRESQESFHSIESWHSSGAPLDPSPPTSQAESPTEARHDPNETDTLSIRTAKNKRSQSTGSSPMPCAWESDSDEDSETSHESAIPASDADRECSGGVSLGSIEASSSVPIRPRFVPSHRATTSSISVRRRALSPLPPAANLFTPASTAKRQPYRSTYRSKFDTVKNLPMAIIAKTLDMIIGPPSYLITLMLKVAAKIAAGEWRGLVYGYNDNGEQIPVQWDYSEGEFSDWSDDEHYMDSQPDRSHDKHNRGREPRPRADRNNRSRAEGEALAVNGPPERPESRRSCRSMGVD
ncbi:hypothetical protein ACHAPJ_008918 [Fusarium lateritium]